MYGHAQGSSLAPQVATVVPVIEESKTSARCLGVLFASNKIKGGFLGAVLVACHIIQSQRARLIMLTIALKLGCRPRRGSRVFVR